MIGSCICGGLKKRRLNCRSFKQKQKKAMVLESSFSFDQASFQKKVRMRRRDVIFSIEDLAGDEMCIALLNFCERHSP